MDLQALLLGPGDARSSSDAWSDAELLEHLRSPTEGCTSTAPSVLKNLDLTAREQSKAQLPKCAHAKSSNSSMPEAPSD